MQSLNCSFLDAATEEGISASSTDSGFAVLTVAGLMVSFTLIAFGERVAKPIVGVVAFTGASSVVYELTRSFSYTMECTFRVVLSIASGAAAAFIAWCLLRAGLSFLGAAAFGSVAHFVYQAIPSDQVPPFFSIAGESTIYYIGVGLASLSGAVASVVMRKEFIRLTSSLIGGAGVAAVVHLSALRSEVNVPQILYVVVICLSAVVGVLTQYLLSKRRRKKRNEEDSH